MGTFSEWLWGATGAVFVNTTWVIRRQNVRGIGGFAATLTQTETQTFSDSTGGERPAHLLRQTMTEFGDKPEKTNKQKKNKSVGWWLEEEDVWVLPLCESFSGLPVHSDTGSQVLEASTVREECVFCCCWRGLWAGSKPGSGGLATCPKSKL